MLVKTITYTDYNGNERTEDFYFNLTKAELINMEVSVDGGFSEMLKKIIREKSAPKLSEYFQDLIKKAYGVKSDDGRRFMKSDEITRDFTETEAYSILYTELVMDDKAAAAFVNGIMPKDIGTIDSADAAHKLNAAPVA